MRRELADSRVKFHVGDVRDYRSVEDAVDGVATSSTRRRSSRCRAASSSRSRRC